MASEDSPRRPNTVGVEQVARALNVSARRIQQLVAHGMPQIARGQYELGACMLWYIRHLQGALKGRSSGGEDGSMTSLMSERTKEARERTERLQMQNLKERGELLHIDTLRSQHLRAFGVVTRVLTALPQRIASDEQTLRRIEAECKTALNQLADDLETIGGRRPHVARRRKFVSAKAAKVAKPVGGSVPGAAEGKS